MKMMMVLLRQIVNPSQVHRRRLFLLDVSDEFANANNARFGIQSFLYNHSITGML